MPPQKGKFQKATPVKQQQKGRGKKPIITEPEDSSDIDEEDIDDDSEGIEEQIQLLRGNKRKMPVPQDSEEDDDEDEDDDDIDEDDLDELDEDLDDEEVDMDDEDEDEDEDEEVELPPKKKLAANGKEAVNEKKLKDKKEEQAKKQEKSKADVAEKHESRESAVGPITAEEKEVFSQNFRAMSATSIFVGKLPADVTDEDLKKLHPAIKTVRRPKCRKGTNATFGFLNFVNKETADRALKEINKKGPVKIRGVEILASANGQGQCHPPTVVDRRKLKIYGCPKHISKENIQKALPGCVEVLLGERERGNAVEAVAIFKTSAEAKKILTSKPTLTLNEVVCALFYLNISHNIKQNERKKDRKRAAKKKRAALEKNNRENEDAEDNDDDSEDDDDDDEEEPQPKKAKKGISPKKTPTPAKPVTPKGKKRAAPHDEEDEDEEIMPKGPKGKKVSMKSPAKVTPVVNKQNNAGGKKTPRKGTPFQKRMKV